jgi:hypothetical protein
MPLASALADEVRREVGAKRFGALIVEFGGACGSALRGPVQCTEGPSTGLRAIVADIASKVDGAQAREQLLARAAAGVMQSERPLVCATLDASAELLLVDSVDGADTAAVVVYRALTTEPGTSCRVAGGAKIRLEFTRAAGRFVLARRTVLEYY